MVPGWLEMINEGFNSTYEKGTKKGKFISCIANSYAENKEKKNL